MTCKLSPYVFYLFCSIKVRLIVYLDTDYETYLWAVLMEPDYNTYVRA